MNDNLKMLGRYAITAFVSFAVGKGWVQASQASEVTNILLQFGAVVVGAMPIIYAWLKIDNAPKT